MEDIRTVLQRYRLRWFAHVQRKDEEIWIKKCMKYPELTGYNISGRPK